MSIELFEIVQSGNIGMQLGATPFVQGFDDVDWEQPLECFDIVEAIEVLSLLRIFLLAG